MTNRILYVARIADVCISFDDQVGVCPVRMAYSYTCHYNWDFSVQRHSRADITSIPADFVETGRS